MLSHVKRLGECLVELIGLLALPESGRRSLRNIK
jgi:hypothetical protein